MANKIIYDSIATGHHPEYIVHIVNYLMGLKTDDVYYFVLSADIKENCPEIFNKSKTSKHIVLEWIPTNELNKIKDISLAKRSFLELKLVEFYATKWNAVEVFLLYFNVFQLALIFRKPQFNIKGILFLQFLRMPKNGIKNKIKFYRKYAITKFYSKNSTVKSVFVLNDHKTVNQLNKDLGTNIFKMLPDPIPLYKEEKGFNVYNYYNIPKNKKILLHPGAINPRKGTYEIIEAIDQLTVDSIKDYAILIVGKAKPDIESEILNKIESLRNKNFQIIFDNSFVSNERLKSLFLQSKAVLMPYKNPEASSGILGHSILANKLVVAPNSGLIGEIVREKEIGIVIDNVTSKDIAKAIEKIETFKLNSSNAEAFVNSHSSIEFSKILLSLN